MTARICRRCRRLSDEPPAALDDIASGALRVEDIEANMQKYGIRREPVPESERPWSPAEYAEAQVTKRCPRDGGRVIEYPNPRQAPGFGRDFKCTSCGATWTE